MLARRDGAFAATFRGHSRLVAAMVVDGIGTGLFLPFGIVYFLHTTSISLAAIGASLSAAAFLALPTPIAVGPLIDRYGPRRMVAAGNLLSAVAFAGYLIVGSVWQLIAAALVVNLGQATFWTATRVLVSVVAGPEHRASWFALQTVTRNVGYGVGAIGGALAVGSAGVAGYYLLAATNAASFVLAGSLVVGARVPEHRPSSRETSGQRAGKMDEHGRTAGYRRLITDPTLLTISAVNIIFILCNSVLSVLLALYVTSVLHAAVWLSGVLFAGETILVIGCQAAVTSRANRHARSAVLTIAAISLAFAFALLWSLSAATSSIVVPGLIIFLGAFAFGGMLQGPVINALVTEAAPTHNPGRYLALFQLSWSIGGAMAPALLTWLLNVNPALPWITLIGGCGLIVVALRTTSLQRNTVELDALSD